MDNQRFSWTRLVEVIVDQREVAIEASTRLRVREAVGASLSFIIDAESGTARVLGTSNESVQGMCARQRVP